VEIKTIAAITLSIALLAMIVGMIVLGRSDYRDLVSMIINVLAFVLGYDVGNRVAEARLRRYAV